MRQQKRKTVLFLFLLLMLLIMPAAAFGETTDSNQDGYHDGDVKAIKAIIKSSTDLADTFSTEKPDDWEKGGLVKWDNAEPKRVVLLDLIGYEDFKASPDISPLSELTEVYIACFSDNVKTLNTKANTKLRVLECTGTHINKLDVSKNAALEKLYFSETGVKSIDVTGNPALTHLVCAETRVSALDVSKNPELQTLVCYDTRITELDVSKNQKLTNLNCHNTGVKKLDVKGLKVLESLYCSGTKVEALNLSKNTLLEYLDCAGTKISSLNLSANKKLLTLDIGGTSLTTLDLSNNIKLKRVALNDTITRFTGVNGCKVTVKKTSGGTTAANYYDVETNKLTLRAEPKSGYWLSKWSGLPKKTEIDDKEAEFVLSGDVEASAVFTKTPIAVKDLKVKTTSTKYLKLVWDELEGADGYKVYQYNSRTKKYKQLKSIAGEGNTAYTVKKLSPGKSYKFKVRAFANGKNGTCTMLKAPTKPSRTAITKLSTGSSKHYIKAAWEKKTGTGYQIKIATDSNFKKNMKVYKVTSYKTHSKKMTNLKKGRTYYIKVRAYKTYGGETVYGSWSETKKKKCK